MQWLVLIYTVPRSPTRKRALIWRELKKIGAVYLRDGVCVLPDRDDSRQAFHDIATTIREFEGLAIVIEDARLDTGTVERIVAESMVARRAEYDEIKSELTGFLDHIEREQAHRAMTDPDLAVLEADLDKLRRWIEQVRSRDYFNSAAPEQIVALIGSCSDALGMLRNSVNDETGCQR